MTEHKHSPLPWAHDGENVNDYGGRYEQISDAGGCEVSGEYGGPCEVDAAFIVHACNSHYELLEALEEAMGWNWLDESDTVPKEVKDQCAAALKKAKGEVK